MTAPPPLRRPPELMDELVEEILLCVSPDEPACLARAAVVCMRWCRLVTDPSFRHRFRQFHRTPLLLGFIVSRCSCGTHFLPSSGFRPSDDDCRRWFLVDARHGRILFYNSSDDPNPNCKNHTRNKVLIVWTPATGEVRKLPMLWLLSYGTTCHWNAALLCGAPGCDHMECPSGGPFTVILVGGRISGRFTYAYVCSSEDDEWSKTDTIELPVFFNQDCTNSALVRNALYFLLEGNKGILEYNLTKKELSVIELPPICNESNSIVLMTVDDDGLGFAMLHDFSLCIWLRDSAPTSSGGWTWTRHKVVDIKSFLPVSALSSSTCVIAAADVVGVFVIWTNDDGVLAIDPKSGQVKKVSDGDDVVNVIPYMSFCTPALSATSKQ